MPERRLQPNCPTAKSQSTLFVIFFMSTVLSSRDLRVCCGLPVFCALSTRGEFCFYYIVFLHKSQQKKYLYFIYFVNLLRILRRYCQTTREDLREMTEGGTCKTRRRRPAHRKRSKKRGAVLAKHRKDARKIPNGSRKTICGFAGSRRCARKPIYGAFASDRKGSPLQARMRSQSEKALRLASLSLFAKCKKSSRILYAGGFLKSFLYFFGIIG